MDKKSFFTDSFQSSPVTSANMSSAAFIGAVEDEWQMYSDVRTDYTIGEPIGFGASSIVYAATHTPPPPAKPTSCALKVLDLDTLPPRSLHLLQRETRLMSLFKHPNVLRVRGSWTEGHKLYIALRLMNKGSAADVMRYGWPGGMEEEVCRCILRQALQGLNYLHINGFIHRDIKAANLLIDDDGTVLLGDLGVAADLLEDSSHQLTPPHHRAYAVTAKAALAQDPPQAQSTHSNKRASHYATHNAASVTRPKMGKRKSFVGTPCWMAPELIQGKQYDSSADIWSFGITAIELTQGRAPRSRDPAKTVLLKTVQEDPPTIDREGGTYRYSRAFKEIVDRCLAKDPAKRPTAEELLQTPFFKGSKKKPYLMGAILRDLPPLTQRQERRLINGGTVVHPTIDSWDFPTTIHSPGSSLRRYAMFDLPLEAEEASSVYNPYDAGSAHESDDCAIQSDDALDENEAHSDGIPIPSQKSTVSGGSSDPPSFPTSCSAPSSASDSPLTTPKSYPLSPEEIRIEETALPPLPPPACGSLPLEGITSLPLSAIRPDPDADVLLTNKSRMILSPRPQTSPHRHHKMPHNLGSQLPPQDQAPTETQDPPSQGMWQKFRTNVKRTSLRASFGESTASPISFAGRAMTIFGENFRKKASRDPVKRGNREESEREQSGMGPLAAGRGKSGLSRTLSRTYQSSGLKQSSLS